MTSDLNQSRLTIVVRTRKLQLEQRGGELVPSRQGPTEQTTCVLSIQNVSRDNAANIVEAWRRANPDVPHHAEWTGPTAL